MVCQPKATHEIDEAVGEVAIMSRPTWVAHLYSCRFRYATGAMTLSVKELSSWPQTLGYFGRLGTRLNRTTALYNLGQGAFIARDGSVVVRKDWKVLLVDTGSLPSRFGQPLTTRGQIALAVAGLILGCWHGD
jgi:hypothetical protein